MSNFGQAALAITGAVVGFVASGGNPYGAYIGFSLGLSAGGLLFPEDFPGAQGPRVSDSSVTSATIGSPIVVIRGRSVTAGNIIWTAELQEHANTEEVGGKGGPKQEVTNYTYTRSYAVALCRGEIAGVLRVWRNDKIVYDIRPQQAGESDDDYGERVAATQGYAEKFTLYPGSETQLPDPTIEAVEGAGNVPAFRGLAYVVFEDEDQTDTGGRPANWKFEVVSDADDAGSIVVQRSTAVLYSWDMVGADPRACLNDHEFRVDPPGTDPVTEWGTFSDAIAALEVALEYQLSLDPVGWSPYNSAETAPYDELTGDPEVAEIRFTKPAIRESIARYIGNDEWVAAGGGSGNPSFAELFALGVERQQYTWISATAGLNHGAVFFITDTIGDPAPDDGAGWIALNNCIPGFGCPYPGGSLWALPDAKVQARRVARMPAPPCTPRCDDAYPAVPENPDYCVIDGEVEHVVGYNVASGSFKALANLRVDSGEVTDYPQGPVVVAGSELDVQAYWEQAYGDALAAGAVLRSGLTYGVGYPVVPTVSYVRSYIRPALNPVDPTVASIVQGICEMASLQADRIDVSQLTETVPGYRLASVMTARQAIQPLQAYSFFDCVESDGLLKFKPRGSAIVATLGDDDLAARFAGETAPPLVSMERQQDVELPQLLRLHYEIGSKDYQPGLQQAQRLTTAAVNKEDVELAINMTDAKAAHVADVLMQDKWWGRETYKGFASPLWMQLEPGDPVEVPVEGRSERACVVSMSFPLPFGPLELQLKRDDDGSYVSHAVGASPVPATGGVGLIGPTELVIIDSTALDGNANDAGVYLACYGPMSRWAGANIQVSADGGANNKTVATILTAAKMGRAVGVVGAGPDTNIWDYATILTVDLDTGELESRTEDAVLNGANAAFLGADGRWEVLQYQTATYVGQVGSKARYTLSNLLRGRRGTEWAQGLHEDGDRFVFIGAGLTRIPREPGDLGRTLQWKAVSLGTLAQAAVGQNHTMQGTALKPYSPCDITAARDADNNLVFSWVRRTRLSGEWLDLVDVPLNEAVEAYQVDILSEAGDVIRTLDSNAQSVEYLLSDEVSDFGNMVLTLHVNVYQLSAVIGRGYPGVATLSTPASDSSTPAGVVEVEFTGAFDTGQVFYANVRYGALDFFYALDGASMAALSDFADALAAALLSDSPALDVAVVGAKVTITSELSFDISVTNNVVSSVSYDVVQNPMPIFSGIDLQNADFDLYFKNGSTYWRAPDNDARYDNAGPGVVYFNLYAATYAANKALQAAIAASTDVIYPIHYYADARPTGTYYGSRKGYTLRGLESALGSSSLLLSLGINVGGSSAPFGAVGVQCSGPYYLRAIGLEFAELVGPRSTHPSGYTPGLTTDHLPDQTTISYPAGAKQMSVVYFGYHALVAGTEFSIEIDSVPFTYTVLLVDEGLDFTPVFDGLKSLIEATGDYDVGYYIYKNQIEIERNVIDTPFVVSARANLLADATVTRL